MADNKDIGLARGSSVGCLPGSSEGTSPSVRDPFWPALIAKTVWKAKYVVDDSQLYLPFSEIGSISPSSERFGD